MWEKIKKGVSNVWKWIQKGCVIIVGVFVSGLFIARRRTDDNRTGTSGTGTDNLDTVTETGRTENAIDRSTELNSELAETTKRAVTILQGIRERAKNKTDKN